VADWTDDEVVIYRAVSGQVERRIAARQCQCVAFSNDDRQMAFTEEDDIVVWDCAAQQAVMRLREHRSTVTYVGFSADGKSLVSSGRDRRINLWNTTTGQLVRTMMAHQTYVQMATFLGPDRVISLGENGSVTLWHATLGTQLCTLRNASGIHCWHFASDPNDKSLVMRLADGTLDLLDLSVAQRDISN